jgi:hypothetical protein
MALKEAFAPEAVAPDFPLPPADFSVYAREPAVLILKPGDWEGRLTA